MQGGVYTHETVIHDANFVNPYNPDIHTKNIENMWMRVKRKLRRPFGTSRALFQTYTFPNFDGGSSTGMMTSSMHLCVASLTYLLYSLI